MELEVTRQPVVVRSGDEGGAPMGSSGRARLKVLHRPDGEAGYALLEAPHPSGAPRIRDHVHERHDETFVVLEGEYTVRLGNDIVVATAGDYVFVPRGTAHTYANLSPTAAKILVIICPSDGVGLLAELGELAHSETDENAIVDLHARYSTRLVAPLRGWKTTV